MIILVSNFLMLQQYVTEVPCKAVELMEEISGPLTVIYPKARNLAENLVPEDGSIGIRIPDDEFCRELISAFGKPIVSTSANVSGMKASSIWGEVSDYIKESVDYATTWRRDDTRISQPSSIWKVNFDGTVIKVR
jgi:L-threonylcarbamoyladenylate synthase